MTATQTTTRCTIKKAISNTIAIGVICEKWLHG